jgi:hypothetical protein
LPASIARRTFVISLLWFWAFIAEFPQNKMSKTKNSGVDLGKFIIFESLSRRGISGLMALIFFLSIFSKVFLVIPWSFRLDQRNEGI